MIKNKTKKYEKLMKMETKNYKSSLLEDTHMMMATMRVSIGYNIMQIINNKHLTYKLNT